MKREKTDLPIFGKNLKQIRKSKSLTQQELGNMAGISKRMIVHYENWAGCPPIEKILKIAKVLKVSVDNLLGVNKNNNEIELPKHPKIWKKFKQFESLTKSERKVITTILDTFLEKKKFAKK